MHICAMFQRVLLSATLPFDLCFSSLFSCVSKSLPLLDSLSCSSVPVSLPVVPYGHQTFPLCDLSILLYTLMTGLMLPVPHYDNKEPRSYLSPALCLSGCPFIPFSILAFSFGSSMQL